MRAAAKSEEKEANGHRNTGIAGTDGEDTLEEDQNVLILSNVLDPRCTVINIYVHRSWPTLLSELLHFFQSSDVFIVKSQVESTGLFASSTHSFHVRSASTGKKLSRDQLEYVQARVRQMWGTRAGPKFDEPPVPDDVNSTRSGNGGGKPQYAPSPWAP